MADVGEWTRSVVSRAYNLDPFSENWDHQMAGGADSLDHVFKILLIGDAGVGKSRFTSSSSLYADLILISFYIYLVGPPSSHFCSLFHAILAFSCSLPMDILTTICRAR